MSGKRLAAKGVLAVFLGVLVFLFGVSSYFDALLYVVIGVLITAGGGVVIGLALGSPYVFGGFMFAVAGLGSWALANLGLVPRDGPVFLFGGIELAAAGLGVMVGAWLRTGFGAAARTNSAAGTGR